MSLTAAPVLLGLIDSHCHLDYSPMAEDLVGTIARARAAGVVQLVHIGCNQEAHGRALALAAAHPEVWLALGIHPHEAVTADDAALEQLAAHLGSDRVVAVGETGLDYHYDRSPRAVQAESLRRHLELSARFGLPLVLHVRDAHADALSCVRRAALPDPPGIVHCFTGTPDEAEAWLQLGFAISFSGIVTFPSAKPVQEAARRCPPDRILVETDAPFLAPVPLRGRPNEPAHVAHTCAFIAALRNEPAAALALQTAANTRRILRIPEPRAVPPA